MRVILLTAVAVLSVGLGAQNIKSDHYLDVPGHTYTPIPSVSFSPVRNGRSVTPHAMLPATLRLTLLSVDRTDFVYGDYFTFEVLIENTATKVVILPWSPNAGEFMQPVRRIPDGFLNGMVSVHVESATGEPVLLSLLDSQPLYGSNEVPGSLLRLEPGRTARVRAPTQWSAPMPQGREAILRQLAGTVRLRARFSLDIDNFPLAQSTNTIEVRVVSRELR